MSAAHGEPVSVIIEAFTSTSTLGEQFHIMALLIWEIETRCFYTLGRAFIYFTKYTLKEEVYYIYIEIRRKLLLILAIF